MFDMSWGEVLVIGGVALIVIGPKDLPRALRTVGQMTTKIRRMASEFQSQFNEAMREADLDDVRREVADLNRQIAASTSSFNPIQTIRDELKGAVDGSPVPPPVTATDPILPAFPVEESGSIPHIQAMPDVAPLPAAAVHDPDLDLAGPGLEGASVPGLPDRVSPERVSAKSNPE